MDNLTAAADAPSASSNVAEAVANTDELSVLAVMTRGLESLPISARGRVLAYLISRFQPELGAANVMTNGGRSIAPSVAAMADTAAATDIRSFRELKAPASTPEMTAVVAYYLSEILPEGERRDTVGTADIEKYFKQAGFPLPARSRNALFAAKTAGYLEEAGGRGEYKLSPVGHNLVTYRLPRGGESNNRASTFRRKPRRSPPPVADKIDSDDMNDTQ